MEKASFKKYVLIITYAIVLLAAVFNLDTVLHYLGVLLDVFYPVFIGIVLAFILDRPCNFFERQFLKISWIPKKRVRLVSVIVTYLLTALFLGGIIAFIIPQFVQSIIALAENASQYGTAIQNFIENITGRLDFEFLDLSKIQDTVMDVLKQLPALLSEYLPKILGFTTGLFGRIGNTFLGAMLAVYISIDKKRLLRQLKGMLFAYVPEKRARKIGRVTDFTIDTFSHYVSGQLTEAFILGVLCFIGMKIFGFDYALLISVLIGVTNMIPIVGPWIGAIPSVLILMINPTKALLFIVYIVVLQQIESNFIYPKVVGDSVGLPALWVLFAIVVGGGFFGIGGMIFAVPIVSVIYKLIKEHTLETIEKKEKISKEEKDVVKHQENKSDPTDITVK